jgi:hypothetical protein
MLRVDRVKVRRAVIVEVHGDRDSVEGTDPRHGVESCPARGQGRSTRGSNGKRVTR